MQMTKKTWVWVFHDYLTFEETGIVYSTRTDLVLFQSLSGKRSWDRFKRSRSALRSKWYSRDSPRENTVLLFPFMSSKLLHNVWISLYDIFCLYFTWDFSVFHFLTKLHSNISFVCHCLLKHWWKQNSLDTLEIINNSFTS